MLVLPLIASVLLLFVESCAASVIVETKYGKVNGKALTVKSTYGTHYIHRWYGIPYAKPPIGELRFRPSVPPEPWNNTLETQKLPAACPQGERGIIWLTHPGWNKYSEDCLTLNIFAPANRTAGPYPVMYYIHGGGYVSSASVQYPGHFLATRDVVVVVINYRIGALGFMSTGDANGWGNWGLMDQILGLEWVRDNIRAFGGDPNQVTLFGQSAGAASSSLMMLAPQSEGLFHRVIAQSGSDLAMWAINHPGAKPEGFTKQVAKKLNCDTTDTAAMMECLRQIPAKTVVGTGFACSPGYFCQGFAPVVDHKDGIIPDVPIRMRMRGEFKHIPLLSGQCSDDGSMYTAILVPESMEGGFNRSAFERLLKTDLMDMFAALFPDKYDEVFDGINFYYSPWPHIHDKELNRAKFNELITDFGFGASGDVQMKYQSNKTDVYFYIMGYRSSNAAPLFPEWIGVPHTGELPYVLAWPLLKKNFNIRVDSGMLVDIVNWNEEDIKWGEYYLTLWTNFAKYGNPTPTPVPAPNESPDTVWPKFNQSSLEYLNMEPKRIEVMSEYRQKNFAFWLDYMAKVSGIPIFPDLNVTAKAYPSSRVWYSNDIQDQQSEIFTKLSQSMLKK